MRYLEVGDVIQLSGADAALFSGPGYYVVTSRAPIKNQRIIPDANNFAAWNSIANTNQPVLLTLDSSGPVDLRPRDGQIYQLRFGIRSKFGGVMIYLQTNTTQYFGNSRNPSPKDNGSYKTAAFITGEDSPFDSPSEETTFFLVPATPPAFYANVGTVNDHVELNIEGRKLNVMKIPESSSLYRKIQDFQVIPIQVYCLEDPYKPFGGQN